MVAALIFSAVLLCRCASENSRPLADAQQSHSTDNEPAGKAIFDANCASCHNPLKDAMGPALKGAVARWNNDTTKLKSFIRNPAQMYADGDPYVVALFGKYKTMMTGFNGLTEAELDALIKWME